MDIKSSAHWEISLSSDRTYENALQVIKSLSLHNLSISHRHPGLRELSFVKRLRTDLPDHKLVPHISLRKLHLGKTTDIHVKLKNWVREVKRVNPEHILVISGYPRMKHDTLWALKELEIVKNTIPLAVAYNPFISNHGEEGRLHQKLAFPSVKHVYLQIGENPYYIEHGVKIIRDIRPDINIFGCLLLPTPLVRNNLGNSPWHGVIFSEDYLRHPIHAWEVASQSFQTFERLGITPLVEALPFKVETCADFFHM